MKKFIMVLLILALAWPISGSAEDLEWSLGVDLSGLKSTDGQQLILSPQPKEIPARPSDPKALPKEDPLHWYDMEFVGWGDKKINIPESPKDGAKGHSVIVILNGDHPYLTAYSNGAQMIADAYKMKLTVWSPNWDSAKQNQMIDEAIIENPDMLVWLPLDAKLAVQQARKVNRAGIPIILSNMLPEAEALKYAIAWTGPDDWGQMRMVSRAFADKIGKKGGIAYTTHSPGGSPYFARMWGPRSEFSSYAPGLEFLDAQWGKFQPDENLRITLDWITRFGDKLNGIVCAGDGGTATGVIEALKKANRSDVLVMAAGNSKTGMDYVKSGDIYAISYQSPMADGAYMMKAAADWFNGKEVDPVTYLPKHVITKKDVENFYPPQW